MSLKLNGPVPTIFTSIGSSLHERIVLFLKCLVICVGETNKNFRNDRTNIVGVAVNVDLSCFGNAKGGLRVSIRVRSDGVSPRTHK